MPSQLSWGFPGRLKSEECVLLGCPVSPPCPTQLVPESQMLPKCIPCDAIRRETVHEFALERGISYSGASDDYMSTYPLPIGATAIGQWLHKREQPPHLRQRPPGLVVEEPQQAQPQPLVEYGNAWLGLAILREVNRHEPYNMGYRVTTDLLGMLPLDRSRIGTVWLLGLVELVGESARTLRFGRPGLPGYMEVPYPLQTWRFIEPIFLTESCARAKTERESLAQAEQHLRQWYAKFFLNQKIKTGRPRGTGTYESPEKFLDVISAIIRDWKSQGKRFSQQDVAEKMDMEPRNLRWWLKQASPGTTWEELVRNIT